MERTNTAWPTGVTDPQGYTSLHVPYDVNFLGGSIAAQFRRAYRYDALGRIDTEQRNNGSNTSQRAFAYDGLSRLSRVDYRNQACNVWPTSATVDTASGWNYTCASPDSSVTYTYDAVGNRTDHGAVVIAGNRYQSFNNASYAYDTDGNVIQKYDPARFNRQFFWSAENRLDSLVQGGWWRIHYEYNAFGQPVKKWRGDPSTISVDRYYLWDGDQLLADMDGSFNRVADYVYAPGIDQPFAGVFGFTTATSIRYHAQDELGNVLGHFEGTSINQLNDYDPWGTPTVTISGDSRLLWKGLMWEGDVVSLYYMRNRWYDPESGRFLSEDPLGVEAGLNQYSFVNDDPINGFDPTGLECTIKEKCEQLDPVTITGKRSDPAGGVIIVIEGGGAPSGPGPGPRGGGTGGGGGGSSGSGSRRGKIAACNAAGLKASLTVAGDILTLGTIKLALLASRGTLIEATGRLEAALTRASFTRREYADVAGRAAARTKAALFATGVHANAVGLDVANSATISALSGQIGWEDVIPGVSSGFAIAEAYVACK